MSAKNNTPGKLQPEPTAAREPLKHSWIGFAGIWIIIITCSVTNLFILKMPQLMLSTIPIIIITAIATLRVYMARVTGPGNHGS